MKIGRLRRLNSVLKAVRNINQLVTRESSRDRFLDKICEILVADRGYGDAWIGLTDGAEVRTVAVSAGDGERIRKILEKSGTPDCVARALERPEPVVVLAPAEECGGCPPGAGRDYTARLAVRLEFENRIFGFLSVSVPPEAAADPEEKTVLAELAADIAFALDRFEAEAERCTAEERFRELFENMSSGAAVCTAVEGGKDFLCVDFNAAAERIDEISRKDVIGKRLTEVFAGAKETGILDAMRRVWETGKSFRLPLSRYVDDRVSGWRENYFYRLSSGEVVAIYRDVTEQKRSEAELKRREEFLDATGRMAKVGGWEHDLLSGEAVWTPALYEILELDSGPAPGPAKYLEHYFGSDREILAEAYRKAVDSGEPFDLELRVRTYRGRWRWGRVHGEPVFKNGRCRKIWGAFQDITDRKAAAEELKKLNLELEERVRRRTAELEAFSYSVSHDLRAPLRAMDGFSQKLLEDYGSSLDEKGRHYLQRVRAGAQKMGRLIDDLLSLSRLERREMSWETFDLAEAAREVYEDLKPEREGRRVEFAASSGPVRADRTLFKVLLVNLVSNALKFSRERDPARIEVGCRREGEQTVYYVRDNGVGFDMKYADKIFTPFQRLHREDEYEGTGIGLATAQRVVSRHGGTIRAESGKNKGAAIFFTLGADPEEAPPPRGQPQGEEP
ncbi:MAG TPA: ATP-binding protein [bacterium]|nr:ATP-binding protein [bacterium]HPQ66848.1 ATP-binding protein [bacterium]